MRNKELEKAWVFLTTNDVKGYTKGISKLEASIPAWTFTMWKESNPDDKITHEISVCEGGILTSLMLILGTAENVKDKNPEEYEQISFGNLWANLLSSYFELDLSVMMPEFDKIVDEFLFKHGCSSSRF